MAQRLREWLTASQIAAAALPGLPTSVPNVIALADREWRQPDMYGKRWRKREAAGGGFEYHWSLLPPDARLVWSAAHSVIDGTGERAAANANNAYMWDAFFRRTEKVQDEAKRRLQALDMVVAMTAQTGRSREAVILEVGAAFSIKKSSIYNWEKLVRGLPRSEWLPALAPNWKGRTAEAECTPQAWDALYFEYARKSKPTFSYCYRKIKDAAEKNGWIVPCEATLRRRMENLDPQQLILAREGADALKRSIPPQKRDKTVYHALQAVNADGHKFDVKVEWEDGTIGRPMVVCFQDLYSGKFLSHRAGKTENTNLIRLAFGDVLEGHGVPKVCFLDNGKAFASKEMTGGAEHRFRGRIRDEDPEGIMVRLGVQVHFTNPYSGQSKPIERGFGDFARDISKDIRFEGAYLGNNALNKPDNYGEKAVPIALFKQVLAEGIREHNARKGRRSGVCAGKYSFDEVFQASYETAVITKVTPAQRQLWLPCAENILVREPYGFIEFMKNEYSADFLLGLMGDRVAIRFDPDNLHDDLYVYRGDRSFLGRAKCTLAVGFNSRVAAEEQGKKRADIKRRSRELDDAARKLSLEEHLRLTASDGVNLEPPPETKVVRPVFGNTALKAAPAAHLQEAQDEFMARFAAGVKARRAERERFSIVPQEETGADG